MPESRTVDRHLVKREKNLTCKFILIYRRAFELLRASSGHLTLILFVAVVAGCRKPGSVCQSVLCFIRLLGVLCIWLDCVHYFCFRWLSLFFHVLSLGYCLVFATTARNIFSTWQCLSAIATDEWLSCASNWQLLSVDLCYSHDIQVTTWNSYRLISCHRTICIHKSIHRAAYLPTEVHAASCRATRSLANACHSSELSS